MMSNIFELTAFMNPTNPIIRWLWLASDGSVGYTEDDYMKNMSQYKFIRPEWNINTIHNAIKYITEYIDTDCIILKLQAEYNEIELKFNIRHISTYIPMNIKVSINDFEKELSENVLSRSLLDKMNMI